MGMADVSHHLQGALLGCTGAGVEAEKLERDLETALVACLPDLAEASFPELSHENVTGDRPGIRPEVKIT
jgi:hypothetical protein